MLCLVYLNGYTISEAEHRCDLAIEHLKGPIVAIYWTGRPIKQIEADSISKILHEHYDLGTEEQQDAAMETLPGSSICAFATPFHSREKWSWRVWSTCAKMECAHNYKQCLWVCTVGPMHTVTNTQTEQRDGDQKKNILMMKSWKLNRETKVVCTRPN